MRDNRKLLRRLSTIVELQGLRALASRSELARAQGHRDAAAEAVDRDAEAMAEKAADIERLLVGDTLDICALGIGQAMLQSLARARAASGAEFERRQTEEEQRRRDWNIDRNLKKRAHDIYREARQRDAEKRDDAASLEVVLVRLVQANGVRQ